MASASNDYHRHLSGHCHHLNYLSHGEVMDELGLKLAVAAHVAELRQMAKEAEDFVIRLSHLASTVEHQYRYLRERDVPTSERVQENTQGESKKVS